MTLGPLEYTVIGFEGNRFNGEIAKEINAVIDSGTSPWSTSCSSPRTSTATRGPWSSTTRTIRASPGSPRMLEGLTGLLTEEDIDKVAAELPIEHLRPRDHVRAPLGCEAQGGDRRRRRVPRGRETIPPEALEMLNAELEAAELTADANRRQPTERERFSMRRRRGPGLLDDGGRGWHGSRASGTSHANKKAAQQQNAAATQQQLADQDAEIAALQAQQAAAAAPAPAAGPAPLPAAPAVDPVTAQLTNLASLHAAGILSDEEFAAAKAKALGI